MNEYILVIEDNEDIRESIMEILSLEGYRVLSADCGLSGLDLATEALPDLVICDIVMRDVDGYSVFNTLHKTIATKNIPVIFSTAKSERSERRKAMLMGIEDYLVKPFDDKDLLIAVKKVLDKHTKLIS